MGPRNAVLSGGCACGRRREGLRWRPLWGHEALCWVGNASEPCEVVVSSFLEGQNSRFSEPGLTSSGNFGLYERVPDYSQTQCIFAFNRFAWCSRTVGNRRVVCDSVGLPRVDGCGRS
eukprot:1484894-Pyramimonas_sp.AAC.1